MLSFKLFHSPLSPPSALQNVGRFVFFAKFRKFSDTIFFLWPFPLFIFPFWDFGDVNVGSFVIVSPVPEALFFISLIQVEDIPCSWCDKAFCIVSNTFWILWDSGSYLDLPFLKTAILFRFKMHVLAQFCGLCFKCQFIFKAFAVLFWSVPLGCNPEANLKPGQ